jgi:hypothetical protein
MTIDQLERDLKTLAEPKAEDEHLRLTLRATLGDQLRKQPHIRRRRRLGVGSAALAAATAVAAIVALIGTGGSGGPTSADAAIIAHVARAMSPPANLIVHVSETGVQPDGTRVAAEWWQETNPPYAMRLIKAAAGSEHEGATNGTTTCSLYDPGTNTIHQHTNCALSKLIDPVETARADLANGTAKVAGTVTIDGQSLYKIALGNGVTGYFDQTTYRPAYLDNPQGDGSVVRTHVLTYEELPLTAANQNLLSLTAQHPNARVETTPAPTK